MTYRKRRLNQASVDALLAELTLARDAALRFRSAAPIHGEHYRAAGEVADAIKRFGVIATGDPDHFMPRQYSPPGPSEP